MRTLIFCSALSVLAAFSARSSADDSTPILHPVEAACIEYEMSGQMQQGTSTRCHRDFAYEQYEIQNISIGFGGFSQSQNKHNINIGNTIYSIDLDTNTGTQTINPMYDGIVSAMQDTDPADMASLPNPIPPKVRLVSEITDSICLVNTISLVSASMSRTLSSTRFRT